MPLVRAPSQLPVLTCTQQLTAADLHASLNSPVPIVPAPGAGKIIVVLGIAYIFKAGSVPYTVAPGVVLQAFYDGADNDIVVPISSDLLSNAASGFDYESGSCQAPGNILPGNDNQAILCSPTGLINRGPILTAAVGAGGTGYAPNDTGTITTGGGDATYKVLTVDGAGAVLTFSITAGGTDYAVGAGQATATGGGQPGIGINFTVDVTAVQIGDGTLKVVTYYQIIDVP